MMLDRIIAQIALALFNWLDKRIQMGSVAFDADVDRDRLSRAGRRVDEWLREQNRIHSRGQPNQTGTTGESASIHTPEGGVDSKQQ
jgi:hypothetical protein